MALLDLLPPLLRLRALAMIGPPPPRPGPGLGLGFGVGLVLEPRHDVVDDDVTGGNRGGFTIGVLRADVLVRVDILARRLDARNPPRFG